MLNDQHANKSLMATTSTFSLLYVSLKTILPILPKPFIPNFTVDISYKYLIPMESLMILIIVLYKYLIQMESFC